jgi:hypothetical protein
MCNAAFKLAFHVLNRKRFKESQASRLNLEYARKGLKDMVGAAKAADFGVKWPWQHQRGKGFVVSGQHG